MAVFLGRKNSLRRNLFALLIAAPWLLVAGVRFFALDSGWPLVPLVAFTPQTLLTMLLPLAVALFVRARWAAALVVCVMVALAVVIAPRLSAGDQPAANGREVRIFSANLRQGQAASAPLAEEIRRARPDIISLQEASSANVAALRARGVLGEYRYVEQNAVEGLLSNITVSRWPLTAVGGDFAHTDRWPGVRVAGLPIDFYDFHSRSPLSPGRVGEWEHALGSLPARPAAHGRLRLIAGDFNATVDHRAFRALLARGFVDAGSVTGNGLVWTWSIGRLTRLVIDHVLVPPGVRVESYRVVDLPGSDHNAVIVALRLPPH